MDRENTLHYPPEDHNKQMPTDIAADLAESIAIELESDLESLSDLNEKRTLKNKTKIHHVVNKKQFKPIEEHNQASLRIPDQINWVTKLFWMLYTSIQARSVMNNDPTRGEWLPILCRRIIHHMNEAATLQAKAVKYLLKHSESIRHIFEAIIFKIGEIKGLVTIYSTQTLPLFLEMENTDVESRKLCQNYFSLGHKSFLRKKMPLQVDALEGKFVEKRKPLDCVLNLY